MLKKEVWKDDQPMIFKKRYGAVTCVKEMDEKDYSKFGFTRNPFEANLLNYDLKPEDLEAEWNEETAKKAVHFLVYAYVEMYNYIHAHEGEYASWDKNLQTRKQYYKNSFETYEAAMKEFGDYINVPMKTLMEKNYKEIPTPVAKWTKGVVLTKGKKDKDGNWFWCKRLGFHLGYSASFLRIIRTGDFEVLTIFKEIVNAAFHLVNDLGYEFNGARFPFPHEPTPKS